MIHKPSEITKPKIVIGTLCWQRPEVTELAFRNWKRTPYEIVAVVSEPSLAELCKKYDISYYFHDNKPLGKKKNYLIEMLLQYHKWDYLLEMGSDDLFTQPSLPEIILYDLKQNVGMTGSPTCFFYDLKTDKKYQFSYTPKANTILIGAGRLTSRQILEDLHPLFPPHFNKGLDSYSELRIGATGTLIHKNNVPYVIDVKSDTNIWSIEDIRTSLSTSHTIKERKQNIFQKEDKEEILRLKKELVPKWDNC